MTAVRMGTSMGSEEGPPRPAQRDKIRDFTDAVERRGQCRGEPSETATGQMSLILSIGSEEGPPRTAQRDKIRDFTDAIERRGQCRGEPSETATGQMPLIPSIGSEEGPPRTAQREKHRDFTDAVERRGQCREELSKAATGHTPLIPDTSVSQMGGSDNLMGQMSTARGSTELRPPPDFTLGLEYWTGLRETIRTKLWQAYRLVHPNTIAEAEESTRVLEEGISRVREALAEKAQEGLAEEARSDQEFGPTIHQDWPRQPLKAARAEVSAWVGSQSERRYAQGRRWTPRPWDKIAKFIDKFNTLSEWKFHSLRELGSAQCQERMDLTAQRAIVELGRAVENDFSWRSSFPELADIKAAILKDLWDHMESFSQGLQLAVWDVLQNLVRATLSKTKIKCGSGHESVINVKISKADFPSWSALIETWGTGYNIQKDGEPPLLARRSDPKTKPATFSNMRICPKPFLDNSGLTDSNIGELRAEPEKESVGRTTHNRSKINSEHTPKSNSAENATSRQSSDRLEVAVTTVTTKNFVKTPNSSDLEQTYNPMMGCYLLSRQ